MISDVAAVDRRTKGESFPILSLEIVVVVVIGCAIGCAVGKVVVLLQGMNNFSLLSSLVMFPGLVGSVTNIFLAYAVFFILNLAES